MQENIIALLFICIFFARHANFAQFKIFAYFLAARIGQIFMILYRLLPNLEVYLFKNLYLLYHYSYI